MVENGGDSFCDPFYLTGDAFDPRSDSRDIGSNSLNPVQDVAGANGIFKLVGDLSSRNRKILIK